MHEETFTVGEIVRDLLRLTWWLLKIIIVGGLIGGALLFRLLIMLAA